MGESQVMQESLVRVRRNITTCRDLAETAITPAARDVLSGLAEEYERQADLLERFTSARPKRRAAFKWGLD
jgi:hypothetical protein